MASHSFLPLNGEQAGKRGEQDKSEGPTRSQKAKFLVFCWNFSSRADGT